MTVAWPWPGDSREDKIKRVAHSYRNALKQAADDGNLTAAFQLELLDRQWAKRGITWHTPNPAPPDPDDWVPARDAAMFADVNPDTIRQWGYRNLIRADHRGDGTPVYNIGDLMDLNRQRRQARIPR